jgi:hypothetical protein
MSTCTTCYGTNTTQPCASVGCLSTNYGKCITYSGSNLFCQKGSIATFTFAGTAVSPTINTTVVASVTGGTGTGATFSILRTAGQTTYEVTLVNAGSNYQVSDVLTILGTSLGGASPLNDITLTVTTLAAVISNGDNLDTVISNLNNRLCLVSSSSPSGLDYTAFNYACLRVGGNLEGVGTVITTAQGFTEAVAAALCSLNVRVKDLEKPQIIVDTYFGGSLTGGVSTLVQILNKYGEAIGDLNDKFTINSPHTCAAFTHLTTLTAKPSSTASLGTWFDWVSTNLCNNFTILDAKITEQINEHTLINTFLYGVNQPYPTSRGNNFVNTLCLTGGIAQSNIRTAVNLLVTELCSLKTTVTAGLTSNYTVSPVTCLNTPFPSNSVFGNNSNLAAVSGTTTLQGHLTQIYNILSNLNIKFSNQFILTTESCGPIISLAPGSQFSCSSLSSCSINNLGDVNIVAPTFNGDSLTYNVGSGQWVNRNINVLINGSNTGVTKSVTSTSVTYDLNISTVSSATSFYYFPVPLFTPYAFGGFVPSTKYPITKSSANGMYYAVLNSNLVQIIGGVRIVQFDSVTTLYFPTGSWFVVPSNANIAPFNLDSEIVFPVTFEVVTSSNVTKAILPAFAKMTISGGILQLLLKMEVTTSLPTMNLGDCIEVVMPPITFTVS